MATFFGMLAAWAAGILTGVFATSMAREWREWRAEEQRAAVWDQQNDLNALVRATKESAA